MKTKSNVLLQFSIITNQPDISNTVRQEPDKKSKTNNTNGLQRKGMLK